MSIAPPGSRPARTLTGICAHFAAKLGCAARVLPMTDDPVRTVVETDRGTLAFQEYFVREQCRPVVRDIRYDGAAAAKPDAQVLEALAAPTLAGVIVCPSNPWLSVEPILALPGLRKALRAQAFPSSPCRPSSPARRSRARRPRSWPSWGSRRTAAALPGIMRG
jgi:LPPG:FO 2-phospho-L-lactate transferase